MRHYGYLPGGRPASRPPAKKTGQVRLILPPLGGQGLAGDHVVSSRSPASSRERRCRWRPSTRCGRRSGHCPAPGREAPVGRALRPSGRGSPLARRPDHKRGAQAQRRDRNTPAATPLPRMPTRYGAAPGAHGGGSSPGAQTDRYCQPQQRSTHRFVHGPSQLRRLTSRQGRAREAGFESAPTLSAVARDLLASASHVSSSGDGPPQTPQFSAASCFAKDKLCGQS